MHYYYFYYITVTISNIFFVACVITSEYKIVIAELPRAKRASKAPWVRKIGNPSSRENLVMTSPYVRTSVRLSVRPSLRPYRLWGRGGESRSNPNRGAEESFLDGIFKEQETHFSLLSANDC